MVALFSFFCRAQETFSARAGKPSADFADDTDLKQKAKLNHLFVSAKSARSADLAWRLWSVACFHGGFVAARL
jgi:hypothetical protein